MTHVGADAAEYMTTIVTERAPDAIRCMDPFHVVQWATRAVDRTRQRDIHRIPGLSRVERRNLRWALLNDPENLTDTRFGSAAHSRFSGKRRVGPCVSTPRATTASVPRNLLHGKHNDPWRTIELRIRLSRSIIDLQNDH
ncbi:transposase [Gordonia sp. NPDC003376]